jgi:hypothetical protein
MCCGKPSKQLVWPSEESFAMSANILGFSNICDILSLAAVPIYKKNSTKTEKQSVNHEISFHLMKTF